MYRWEMFLRRDAEKDMADVKVARLAAPYGVKGGVPLSGDQVRPPPDDMLPRDFWLAMGLLNPTDGDAAEWRRAVMALRSVAGRLEGFRVAKGREKLPPAEADEVMREYVARMHPIIQLGGRPLRSAERMRLAPSVPETLATFKDAAGVYLQVLFGSLVRGFADPLCPDCGATLPPAKDGKASRAKRCRRCAKKRSWDRLPVKVRRERERVKKENQRARLKGA